MLLFANTGVTFSILSLTRWCLHAAQTFTTSSLICLGSLLIKSISLVWLSFTIFSSLVLYWYWSAMMRLQVLDRTETVRANLPESNCTQPPQFTSEPLYHHCDGPADMPVNSCCRRTGKRPDPHPVLTYTQIQCTHTQAHNVMHTDRKGMT